MSTEEYPRTEYTGDPRFPHTVNLDTRNLNRRKPVWRPRWVSVATVIAFWVPALAYLRWVVR